MHGNDRRTKSNMPNEWVIVSNRLTGVVFAAPLPDDQDEASRTRWAPRDPFATPVCSILPLAWSSFCNRVQPVMSPCSPKKRAFLQRLIAVRQHVKTITLQCHNAVALEHDGAVALRPTLPLCVRP
jgi:hypothetical protein